MLAWHGMAWAFLFGKIVEEGFLARRRVAVSDTHVGRSDFGVEKVGRARMMVGSLGWPAMNRLKNRVQGIISAG